MNLSNTFLSDEDVVDFDGFGRAPYAPSTVQRRPLRTAGEIEQRVLALTLNQIANLALLISASSSVVNRLERDASGEAPEAALMMHLPMALSPDAELTHALIRSNLPIEVVAETQNFYTRLGAVRAMTASFCRYPAELRVKGGVHVETLAGGWRELAIQTRALLISLQNLTEAAPLTVAEPASFGRIGRTLYLLATCGEGGTPCLLADGTVEIPDIVERRRHRRFAVDWLGSAYIGNHSAEVRIIDVSAGGLCMVASGLPPTEPVRVAARVLVEVVGVGRLSGAIAWHAATSYGVVFDRTLEAGDPVFVAARSGRRP